MPIAVHGGGETQKLTEEPFRDEAELHSCLERSPYLIQVGSEPPIATVQREVSLPAAGSLDLLLVDAEGVPVAVEVKLSRNPQSRREVVAQAFDYVSDLTQLTVDELDDIVDGALISALDELSSDAGGLDLRKQCGTNLRAGRIKVVVAVDEANEDLVRIVRYIDEHSDLDVRLVSVSKFDGGRLLVPRVLVSGSTESARALRRAKASRPPDPAFEAAVRAYDSAAPEMLRSRGHGRTFRQIRPDSWPRLLHYEFLNYQDDVGVEVHLECDEVRHLADTLSMRDGSHLLADVTLAWDPKWSRQRGRLLARIDKNERPSVVAEAMAELIAMTREAIDEALNP